MEESTSFLSCFAGFIYGRADERGSRSRRSIGGGGSGGEYLSSEGGVEEHKGGTVEGSGGGRSSYSSS